MRYAAMWLLASLAATAAADWGPPHRLPDTVNKVGACDWGVSVSADGNTIYFASDRSTSYFAQDIYYSTRTGNGWSPAAKLPPSINTSKNETGPCISWDGKRLFFDRGVPGTGDGDIWEVEKTAAGWGTPRKISGEVNTPDKWEYSPTVSGDGRYLYFIAEDRPGKLKFQSIWRATWNGAAWVSPVNVESVNTYIGEGDPAPTYDGQYLYFWSLRIPGLAVIFRAKCLGGITYGTPEPVPNLSDPNYDYCDPSLTQDGKTIFFARAPWGLEDWDIYYAEWCEPSVVLSSLGRVKALFR